MTEAEKKAYLLKRGWVSDSGKRWANRNTWVPVRLRNEWKSLGEAMESQRQWDRIWQKSF